MSIHIGFRHCGKKTISVIVDYTIKARQLNPTTVIYVADVDLLDGGKTNDHWCTRFFVPIIEAFSMSLYDFLEKFIRRALITNSVFNSIGAFELVFQNEIDQLDFPQQQQTDLNILRDYMISKSIAVIEHNDLFYNDLVFNDEPDLAMFRNKNENEKFVSHEELQHIKILASVVI